MIRSTTTYLTIIGLSLIFLVQSSFGQMVTLPPSGDNQKSEVTQYLGSLAKVTIKYSSPDVTSPSGEDRTGQIWGQLVPYGMNNLGFGTATESPWRAGANENTTITFSHNMLVEGKPVDAGTYGLHMIVEENEPWTLILSKNTSAWGSYFYDEKDDALRVQIQPEESDFHEWLTYEFIDRQADQTTAALMWENKKVPFTIKVPNVTALYLDNMQQELQSTAGFSWQGWNQAANFALQNDTLLDQALVWAENAVSMPYIGQENFSTLQTKGQILDKLGRTEEAEKTLMQAIDHPTASPTQIHSYGRQLLTQGKQDKALEVFKLNAERHPDTWPVNVGLARGYSAVGDFKKALKYAKMAHEQAPDPLNKDNLQAAIQILEQGEDFNQSN